MSYPGRTSFPCRSPESLYSGEYRGTDGSLLLVPMDRRTTASPAGEAEYAFFAGGGMSWAAPYVAGLHAGRDPAGRGGL